MKAGDDGILKSHGGMAGRQKPGQQEQRRGGFDGQNHFRIHNWN
jgi:hypothetical protein